MKNRAAFLLVLAATAAWPAAACFPAENRVDAREIAVDRALGGMEEGSRILPQEESLANKGQRTPGSTLSPKITQPSPTTTASATPSTSTGPQAVTTAPVFVPAENHGIAAGGNFGGGEQNPVVSPEPAPVPEPVPQPEPPAEPSGGEQSHVEQPVVSPEPEPVPEPEPPAEPSGGGSIVDVNAGVDLSGGTPEANLDVAVDTEADTLLQLDATSAVATDTPVAVEAETTESVLVESGLGVEQAINDAPVSGEAEAGIAADVDASGESDEPATNPADGLSTGSLL